MEEQVKFTDKECGRIYQYCISDTGDYAEHILIEKLNDLIDEVKYPNFRNIVPTHELYSNSCQSFIQYNDIGRYQGIKSILKALDKINGVVE